MFYFIFTAKSFVGLVRYIFSLPEVVGQKLAFLSAHINQDPLENFFGCQRQRGGTSDNPNVQEYYQNTQALRVVNSFCRGPVRGNCRRATSSGSVTEESCAPLLKRKKHKLKTPLDFVVNFFISSFFKFFIIIVVDDVI